MFSRSFMRSFPVKKYARQSAAGKFYNKQSRNHQYWFGHVGIERSYPFQSRSFRIHFISYGHRLFWIWLLLWGYQTRSRTSFPCCKNFIYKRLGKKVFPNQLKAPTKKLSKTGTKFTKSRTGSEPFNHNNDSFIQTIYSLYLTMFL